MSGAPADPPETGLDPVDSWPAVVWIAAGLYAYADAPEVFTWWKGALYFLVGAPLTLLVTGTATARLRATMTAMLAEVFPENDHLARVTRWMMDILLVAGEAMLVLFAAGGALRLLEGGV